MPENAAASVSLTSTELYLGLAVVFAFICCWSVMFLILRSRQEVLHILFDRGNLLRMMTVVLVVVAVAYLATIRKLTAESATVFSGIAGYVLGGITRSRQPAPDHPAR